METKIYNQLPNEAKEIRLEVFVKEQGFEEEFDDCLLYTSPSPRDTR